MNWLRSLVCSHLWEEEPRPKKDDVLDTAIIINFKFVCCRKCGKRTRMTRREYTRHLIETKRFGA